MRHQMFFTLMNSVAIVWIVWVKKGGGGVGDGAVEGEGAVEGQGEHKEKVGADVEVMQVLRKLQAPQVKTSLD